MFRHLTLVLRISVILIVALNLTFAGAAANSNLQYKLEARVYYAKIDRNAGARILNLKANKLSMDEPKQTFFIEGDGELAVADLALRFKDGQVTWERVVAAAESDSKTVETVRIDDPESELVKTIARPSLIIPAGKKGTIDIIQSIQSFAPTEDGTYELQTHGNAGFSLNCTVTPGSEPDWVMLDWESTNKRIVGREEVPGVSLPIGTPKITRDSIQQKLKIKLETWCGVFQTLPDQNVVINLIRVSQATGASE